MSVANALRLPVAAVLAAALLAGCGEQDRPDTQITAMLKAGLTSVDAAVLCRQTLSAPLVKRIYGGADRCLAVQAQANAGRTPAQAVDVSRIEVDGERGTAHVVLRGGDEDGTRGALTVTKERGGWRLHDFSTAFLRSEFTKSLTNNEQLDSRLRACVSRSIRTLRDSELRALAFGALAGDPQAIAGLQGFVADCVKALTAPSAGDAA